VSKIISIPHSGEECALSIILFISTEKKIPSNNLKQMSSPKSSLWQMVILNKSWMPKTMQFSYQEI
jgi:hypothetical protein